MQSKVFQMRINREYTFGKKSPKNDSRAPPRMHNFGKHSVFKMKVSKNVNVKKLIINSKINFETKLGTFEL